MSENTFWVSTWAILGAVLLGIIALTTSYYKHQDVLVAELIKGGMRPEAASCAMSDSNGDNPTCALLAARK